MAPRKKVKLTTIVDGSKYDMLESWMGPKQGNTPVADVNEYIESEEAAKRTDPPGSVKAVAKARRRVLGHANGMATSGLTAEALFAEIARLAPHDRSGNPTTVPQVRRVFEGIMALRTTLTKDAADE